MITLLIQIVVLGLVYWLVTLLPLPDFAQIIVKVVFVLVAIALLLQAFGIGFGI